MLKHEMFCHNFPLSEVKMMVNNIAREIPVKLI